VMRVPWLAQSIQMPNAPWLIWIDLSTLCAELPLFFLLLFSEQPLLLLLLSAGRATSLATVDHADIRGLVTT